MRIFCYSILALTAAAVAGCSSNEAKISGRFVGNDNSMLYLQQLLPGSQLMVDSVKTDDKGQFSFSLKMPDGMPAIYNLWCNNDLIPLLVSPGEKVKLYSVGSVANNYTVEGSPGSQEMRELKNILAEGTSRLDSILTLHAAASDDATRQKLSSEYTSQYFRTKREHIAFIVSNPGSLSALYALYQRMAGDEYLFNGDNDIIYYRLVADSTSQIYPDSPFVKALQREIANAESGQNIVNLINEKLATQQTSYPDLDMPDMYGNKHRLSDLTGKVILLDFWSANSTNTNMLNAELREIYQRHHDSGFEVYQVSVDDNKALWVTSVQDQKLPWISVNDLKGSSSYAIMAYQVRSVPANFVIDRNGEIVGKNLYGEALDQKVRQLLR